MSNRFLLEAKNIIKTFPPTVALNDVHFCLRPGEIHGLMGENGSGKSTMCSIVSGIYPYDSGELFLDGEPYCPKNMIDAAAKGVCMIVQEQGTFASTTVAENIFIGKEKQFHNGIRLDRHHRNPADFLCKQHYHGFFPEEYLDDIPASYGRADCICNSGMVQSDAWCIHKPVHPFHDVQCIDCSGCPEQDAGCCAGCYAHNRNGYCAEQQAYQRIL